MASGRKRSRAASTAEYSCKSPTKSSMSLPVSSRQQSMRSGSARISNNGSTPISLSHDRLEKLSITATECPRPERYIAVGQPRYPSPPRTSTLMLPFSFLHPELVSGRGTRPILHLSILISVKERRKRIPPFYGVSRNLSFHHECPGVVVGALFRYGKIGRASCRERV